MGIDGRAPGDEGEGAGIPMSVDNVIDRLRRVKRLVAELPGRGEGARESLADLDQVGEILGRIRARHGGGVDPARA